MLPLLGLFLLASLVAPALAAPAVTSRFPLRTIAICRLEGLLIDQGALRGLLNEWRSGAVVASQHLVEMR